MSSFGIVTDYVTSPQVNFARKIPEPIYEQMIHHAK